jgi:hypothetical protein
MGDRFNLLTTPSVLTENKMKDFCKRFRLGPDLEPTLPNRNQTAKASPGKMTLYTKSFYFSNYRYPLTNFLMELLTYYGVHFEQMNHLGLQKVAHFEIACRAFNGHPTVNLFLCFLQVWWPRQLV